MNKNRCPRARAQAQAERKPFQQLFELPCGCGVLLASEKPEACGQCKQRERATKHMILTPGTCASCGSSAPGLCRTCDRELVNGYMPRVTSPEIWKRIKAED